MKNSRHEIAQLLQSGIIQQTNIDSALSLSKIKPAGTAWLSFIDKLLLWLGMLAITASVLFFIAFNWDEMGRFAKFGLVEILLVISIFLFWKTSPDKQSSKSQSPLLSQVFLFVASILLGALLAFYGQTYQTGADTWQLFATWCVLMFPWVFASRFPALWLVWLGILNLSISLYFQTFRGAFNFIFSSDNTMLWVLISVNAVALVLWEVLSSRFKWLEGSWARRLIALAFGIPLTTLVIDAIFGRDFNWLPLFVWTVSMVVIYVFYYLQKTDLFMLAMACLSGITVILGGAGKILFDNIDDIAGFIVMAILVIVLGGISAIWLKNIHKKEHQKLLEADA